MKYIINREVQIYTGNGKIIIDDFELFKEIKLKWNKDMIEILNFFKFPKSISDFLENFKIKSSDYAENTVKTLINLNILKLYSDDKSFNSKTVLIIGCGALGSLLFFSLSKLKYIKRIILIDDDVVEKKNLQMQVFTKGDVGKFKVDVLETLASNDAEIIKIKSKVYSVSGLCKIFEEFKPDISILCADEPDWKTIASLVKEASNLFSIPYILSKGYIGNTAALPEFYYPNDEFGWENDSEKEEIVLKIENKIEFYGLLPSIFIISAQIENFFDQKEPILYREKGFFDKRTMRLKTFE